MKLEVDLSLLGHTGIRVSDEIIILELLKQKDYSTLYHLMGEKPKAIRHDFQSALVSLSQLGLINDKSEIVEIKDIVDKIYSSVDIPKILELSDEGKKLVGATDENVKDWIEEWRNLFPKGIKSGGYPLRGSKKGCLRKMKKFLKENPTITKDEIFHATEKYLNERKKENYEYTKVADYFIEKDNMSLLHSYIENLDYERNTDYGKTMKEDI